MDQDKITEIFVKVDDFCLKFKDRIMEARQLALNGKTKSRNRACQFSPKKPSLNIQKVETNQLFLSA